MTTISKVVHPLVETLIIGGGPGGLATALGLARARRHVIIFDSGKYRNSHVQHMHNVNTWDHANPASFREAARRELLEGRYNTIKFQNVAITNVIKRSDGIFEATDARDETWLGKTLVLATGVTDVMPDLPGYRECWETSKIFHCLYCHGYEESDCDTAGVIAAYGLTATAQPAFHVSQLAAQFAKKVVIYTNGSVELAQQVKDMVQNNSNIAIDARPIQSLVPESNSNEDPAITLGPSPDGNQSAETISHRFFVHAPNTTPNIAFAKPLGLELSPSGSDVKVNSLYNATNVPGCYAVGDVGSPFKAMTLALSAGCLAAGGVTSELF